MPNKKNKRVVVVGDLHCGHRVGLTPPHWQLNPDNERDAKWHSLQKAQWQWYSGLIQKLRPIHLLIVMGDCVDGPGTKANGRDVIRPQRIDQVEMAEYSLAFAKATHIDMVYGTRYHVKDWEEDVRLRLGDKAKIGAHDWPRVNGVTFDIKHKISGSSIPHGRLTAPAKAKLWNMMWAAAGRQPDADILLRGHVHYCADGGFNIGAREVRFATCPALQGVGTEFGAEQCEGTVDFGFMHFDVTPAGSAQMFKHIAVLPEQVASVTEY